MINDSVLPNTYRYNSDLTFTDFVLDNSSQKEFHNSDLTVLSDPCAYDIGGTIFICLGELSTTPERIRPRARFPNEGLERIKKRQHIVIHRARELRATLGDPLAELARILQDIPVEDDVWDRIAQEPYG